MKAEREFFIDNTISLAKKLLGCYLCRNVDGEIIKDEITETEAYLDESDSASHAKKGKTKSNSAMWQEGGTIYVYLCYGIHEMFNIVSGKSGEAGAVLIRATKTANGPGKLTKKFKINRELNNKKIYENNEIWIEKNNKKINIKKEKRIGIEYANSADKQALLRFILI